MFEPTHLEAADQQFVECAVFFAEVIPIND
jgi:hypothetical protein